MLDSDVLFGYRLSLVAHARDVGVSTACRVFGIHRSTYYRWKTRVERSGLEIFQEIHEIDSRLPVMFITATDSSDTAIEAMTLGAYDYLLKPLDLPKLRDQVRQAIEIRRLANVPVGMPGVIKPESRGDLLVGRSPKMQEV